MTARKPKLPLQTFRLKNFKAVRDSGVITFTPLTVFIGNNGVGKSSIIEGLEMIQTFITKGLDEAMAAWYGFEYIQNLSPQRMQLKESQLLTHPMEFDLHGNLLEQPFSYQLSVTSEKGSGGVLVDSESFRFGNLGNANRTQLCMTNKEGVKTLLPITINEGISLLYYLNAIQDAFPLFKVHPMPDWQFFTLHPEEMGRPVPQRRAIKTIKLAKDGSNIAEFLLNIRRMDAENETAVLEGIIETLQYVLPYAHDLQPALTSELERSVFAQLYEGDFKIPGWLLSTGTLRILALLAILHHPNPPPVIVIEEVENGLDPRTLNLLVDEIRRVVEGGTTQVILTTHSPYLLDLLSLSQIIVVERDENGSPVFRRPADDESMKKWSEKFSPGRLYTMNQLGRKSNT